jgi:hypothetical protein
VTKVLAHENPKKWLSLFRKCLDCSGVVDTRGIIHGNEKAQSVFFSKKYLKIIEVFDNKLTPKMIQRRKKRRGY